MNFLRVIKKKVIVIAAMACIFLLPLHSKSQMRQAFTDDADATNAINKLSFYSASSGYAAFSNWIGFTSDSGHSFTKKFITTGNVDYNGYAVNITFGFAIKGVKAFSQDSLIAYGNYGAVPAILYSTNAGGNFKLVFHSQFNASIPLTNGVEDMLFPENNNIGYAVDADRILKTTDKGFTWTIIRSDASSYLKFLIATDNSNVFAYSTVYGISKLLKTTNAGAAWQQVTVPLFANSNIQASDFLTPLKGWINIIDAFGLQKVFYTGDGGTNWIQKNNTTATPFSFYKMKFINDSAGFAVAGLFEVYKTTDSGKVWEPVVRDNNFSYLNYSHNDLQVLTANQLWAGGGHGFLEINTNSTAAPLPKAFFAIDTTGSWQTNIIKLINYSKSNYQFKWYINNVLASISYHLNYTHSLSSQADSIQLIVSNGTQSDTLLQYQYFIVPNLPVITAVSPLSGSAGTAVTITGNNFSSVSSVSFGNLPVASFTIASANTINVILGAGATGNVKVTDIHGSYSFPGFTYFAVPSSPPPIINAITPASGPVGTTVILTGSNFNAATNGNIVFFGDTRASVTAASAAQLTCIVPSGASFSHVSVLNTANGLSAFSQQHFNVSFADSSNFTTHSFALALSIPFSPSVSPVATHTRDIDGDGKPDLVTSFFTGAMVVFRNTSSPGNFSFAPAVTIAPSDLVVAIEDVDGDGKPDVITPTNGTTVHVYRNTSSPGNISFQSKVDVPCAGGSQDATVADLDNDGKNDLIVGSYGSGNGISVIKNTSSPGFLSFTPPVNYISGGLVRGVAAGDLDGDGKKDVVSLNYLNLSPNSNFSFFRNTSTAGTLSFTAHSDLPVPGVVSEGTRIAIADMDNDGKADVVLTNDNNFYCIFRNISTPGNIAFAPIVNAPSGFVASSGHLANLSGSARPDIFTANWSYKTFHLLKNNAASGALSFDAPVNSVATGSYNITSSDVDGDGKPDLISTNDGYHSVTIYQNNIGVAVPFPICEGAASGIVSDITATSYQWQQDAGAGFANMTDNADFSGTNTATLNFTNAKFAWNGYRYRCLSDSRFSSNFQLKVTAQPIPSVSISADNTNFCYGTTVVFTATPVNTYSNIVYQWQVNGLSKGGNTNNFSTGTLINGDKVRVVMTSTGQCATFFRDTSNVIVVNVTGDVPSVTIASSAGTFVCPGMPITYTATPVNPGNNPVYQWRIDGVNAGTNSPVFTTSSVANGQGVSLLMTNDPACGPPVQVVSNYLFASVSAATTPTATITVTVGASGSFCEGSAVSFTSATQNEGIHPIYQWQVNGVNATNGSSEFFTSTTLKNNDKVSMILTSDRVCVLTTTANSNVITLTMNAAVVPTLTIAGNTTVTTGTATTLTSAITNGGAAPVYQWQDSTNTHAWRDISGASHATLSYTAALTGDAVKCKFSSNASCAAPATLTSNALRFVVNIVTAINTVPAASYGIRYFPNPVHTTIYIDSLQLSDNWQSVEIISVNGKQNILTKQIHGLTQTSINVRSLAAGFYVAILKRNKGKLAYFKFMKIN